MLACEDVDLQIHYQSLDELELLVVSESDCLQVKVAMNDQRQCLGYHLGDASQVFVILDVLGHRHSKFLAYAELEKQFCTHRLVEF